MKKNGFSFIETVVTVVILSASLLLVFNSYSSIISNEQQRVYYNDPAYIYRTAVVLDFLNHNTKLIESIKVNFEPSSKYVQQIGVNFTNMFENNEQKNNIEQLINTFDINQMFIVKKEFFDCTYDSSTDSQECNDSINDLNSAGKYAKTISPSGDISTPNYYLIIEYVEMSKVVGGDIGRLTKCYISTEQKYGCHYYYASIPISEVYFHE